MMMTRIVFVSLTISLIGACNRSPAVTNPPAAPPVAAAMVDIDEVVELDTPVNADFDLDLPPSNPIPAGKERRTSAQFREQVRKYFQLDVDHYQRTTKDAEQVRVAAREFLDAYGARGITDPSTLTDEQVSELGDKAIKLGSKDPAVILCHTMLRLNAGEDGAEQVLLELEPKLKECGYSLFFQMLVPYRQVLAAQNGQIGEPVLKKARETFVEWIGAVGGDAEKVRIVWEYVQHYMSALNSAHLEDKKRFFDACRAVPKIDPWLLNMIAGRYYTDLAWHYRGSGTMNWVTPDGAQKFGMYLPLAAKYYTRAWQIRPDNPEAPAAMIGIATAEGGTKHTPRGWFDRAVHAEFDHYGAYDLYHSSLLPRWGGSNAELIEFGKECAATKRFDTLVPDRFLEVVIDLHDAPDGDPAILERPGLYEELIAIAQGYEEAGAFGGQTMERWRSCQALLGSMHGDFAVSRTAFEKLGKDLQSTVFSEFRRKPYVIRGLTYAMTGPAKEVVTKLHEAERNNRPLTVEKVAQLKSWLEEARQLDASEEARTYFTEIQTLLGWREAFLQGKWVEMKFDSELSGWNVLSCEHTVEKEDSILMSTRRTGGGMQLQPQLAFPAPYIVEADVEEVQPDLLRHAGICVGDCEHFDSSGKYYWIDRESSEAGMMRFNEVPQFVPIQLKNVNRLRLKVWPQSWELVVNGHLMHRQQDPQLDTNGLLSFGEMTFLGPRGDLRFSRIRIRALDHGPIPPDGDQVAQEAYYRTALKFDPQDSSSQMLLAELLLGAQRFAEAEPLLAKSKELLDQQYWNSSGLNYLFGAFHESAGRFDQAIELYQQTIQVPRFAPYAARRLAWIKATCPTDGLRSAREAQEFLQMAAATADKEVGEYREIEAAVCAEGGQYERAVAAQRQALEELDEAKRSQAEQRLELYLKSKPFRQVPLANGRR